MALRSESTAGQPTPALVVARDGTVLAASEAAIALLGGAADAIEIPPAWRALIAGLDAPGAARADAVFAGGRAWVATAVGLGDGHASIALAPASTACSACSGDGRYRAIIDAVRDGVAIADLDENLLFVNRAMCEMLGYSEAELLARNLRDLVGAEDYVRIRAETALRIRGERTAYEVRIHRADGLVRTVMISAAPLVADDGSVSGAVGIFRDVTERRAVERELEAGRRRLAAQNRTLTALARDTAVHAGDLDNALYRITEASARTLSIPSASIWLFDRNRGELVCADAFDSGRNRHARGRRIRCESCSSYIAALERERVLATGSAATDMRTSQLSDAEEGGPARERALLDVPIRSMGRLIGVLRHEAALGRQWTADEQLFVAALADLVARIAENGERRRIEEEIRAIARFPDENPQPVFRASREGTILYANPSGRDVLRAWSRGVGQRLPEPLASCVTETFDSGTQETIEIGADGRAIRFLTVPVLGDGYVNLYGEDVTELRRSMDELVRTREAALEAAGAKSRFLATMSHEIRTPLNAVLGVAELLADSPLSSEQRRLLELIDASGRSLLHVIDDVLDYSKIEAGRLSLERAHLEFPALVEDVANAMAIAASRKGLELICTVSPPLPATLVGDPARLRQVLLNLLGNAVKFTEQGHVAITSTMTLEGADRATLTLTVSDTGPGVPADKRATIFDAFAQADDSTTRRFGGTGLGLAISARLVEAMGGTLHVEDSLPHGSAFIVTLGCRIERAKPADAPEPASLADLSFVLIEPYEPMRAALAECLRALGATVDTHASIEEARARHGIARADAIVIAAATVREASDARAALEQWPFASGVPRVLLAPSSEIASSLVSDALGACERISKPWRMAELARSVLRAAGIDSHVPGRARRVRAQEPRRDLAILVAEDHPVNRMLVTRLLERGGHRVTAVENGQEAVEAVARGHFDIVLMDVQMPVMDGLDAAREIRRHELVKGSGHVPIIAVTAFALSGDRERCLAAGMDEYLSKPIRADALSAAIARLAAAPANR